MSGARHTPGPWKTAAPYTGENVDWAAQCRVLSTVVHPHPQGKRYAPIEPVICSCNSVSHGSAPANAALIAASPELLTLLRFYVDAFPAFRARPIGAPGSIERQAQEAHIAEEDKARAVLAKVGAS